MITAVDTNILLDVFVPGQQHGQQSKKRLADAYDAGALIVCDLVYAELVPAFHDRPSLDGALQAIGARLSSITSSVSYEAGLRWKQYRSKGGPRGRILTDFLIGAHAAAEADVLLTRDRGFFSTYFPELKRAEAKQLSRTQ